MPEPAPKARVLLSPSGDRVALVDSGPWRRWRVVFPDGGQALAREADLIGWLPMVGVHELMTLSTHWDVAADEKSGECGHADCCYPDGVRAARADVEDLITRVEGETWQR